MKELRVPVVGDTVTYCMIRNWNSLVAATVTETSAENPNLGDMQIRVSIAGKKNQHPTGIINFSGAAASMGHWFWND